MMKAGDRVKILTDGGFGDDSIIGQICTVTRMITSSTIDADVEFVDGWDNVTFTANEYAIVYDNKSPAPPQLAWGFKSKTTGKLTPVTVNTRENARFISSSGTKVVKVLITEVI